MPLSTCCTTSSGSRDFWPSFGRASAQFLVERDERRIAVVDGRQVFERADDGDQVAVFLGHVHRHRAAFAVQQQLHPGHAALELPDTRDGADGVRPSGVTPSMFSRCATAKTSLSGGREGGLDCLDGHRTARTDRRGHAREEDHVRRGSTGIVRRSVTWSLLRRSPGVAVGGPDRSAGESIGVPRASPVPHRGGSHLPRWRNGDAVLPVAGTSRMPDAGNLSRRQGASGTLLAHASPCRFKG